MRCLIVSIIFAVQTLSGANIRNIQISTTDGMTDGCGGGMDTSPFVKIGAKYYYIAGNENVNWFEAAQLCRRIGADLATIETDVELEALSDYLLKNKFIGGERFYLSYTDLAEEGKFVSITTGNPMPLPRWSPGQPDNANNNEDCVHLWVHAGKYLMNDLPCDFKEHYICQINQPKTVSFTVW